MKLPVKILLINVVITIIITFIFSFTFGEYLVSFGVVSLAIALINLFAGLFLLLKKDKRYAQGFLLSGGLLLLVSYTVCTAGKLI